MHTFPVSENDAADTPPHAPLEPSSIASALQARAGAPVLAWASNVGGLVDCRRNPFVLAAHLAFAEHLPLVLSPDDVWLCLVQGLGIHLNLGAESMRGALVAHEGKMKIQVRRDDFIKGSLANDWPGVFNEFSERLGEHLGPKKDLLVGVFSTTGAVERAASQIAVMSAVQGYFDYSLMSLCGIRRMTLLGTVDDWKSVRRRAQLFAEFDLAAWTATLLPVLDQFVSAAGGQVDHSFWRSFYKWQEASGGDVVTGWINVLFPYISKFNSQIEGVIAKRGRCSDEALIEELKRVHGSPVANPHALENARVASNGPKDCEFPCGLSRAPLCWQYLGEDIEMEVVGGFVGVSQDPQTLAVRPAIGWALCERRASIGAT